MIFERGHGMAVCPSVGFHLSFGLQLSITTETFVLLTMDFIFKEEQGKRESSLSLDHLMMHVVLLLLLNGHLFGRLLVSGKPRRMCQRSRGNV